MSCSFSSNSAGGWRVSCPVDVQAGDPIRVIKRDGTEVHVVATADAQKHGKRHIVADYCDAKRGTASMRDCKRGPHGFVAGHVCDDGKLCEGA